MPRTPDTIVADAKEIPDGSRRRLALSDAILLVAATTPGLILLRIASGMALFTINPALASGTQFVESLTVVGGCVLVPMTFAVLVLSLCGGRTSRREIVRGAGFITCIAVTVSTIIPVANFMARVAKSKDLDNSINVAIQFNNFFGRVKYEAGPMIVGCWLALVFTGRRPPGPSWMDRLGVLIGVCFVLMYLYSELYFLLQPFHLW